MIGDEVTVTVLGVGGTGAHRLNAPSDVAVHREEIYQRIKREQTGPDSGAGQGKAPGAQRFSSHGEPVSFAARSMCLRGATGRGYRAQRDDE